jgi:membrane fusion protein, copper/silver efflux system
MKYFFFIGCLILFFSCNNKAEEKTMDNDFYYTCSMDPQVIAYKAGKCPICKMELTRVKKQANNQFGDLELSEQQIQLGNIQIDSIRNGTIGDQMLLTATLNFNQMNANAISARVSGRIDKLYFKNMGDYIQKGDPVYELYSEDLNNAKQEWVLLLDKQRAFTNEPLVNFQNLLQAAKTKLLLWGMTEAQIQELSKQKTINLLTTFYSNVSGYITALNNKEGDYLMEGNSLIKLSSLDDLWAEAQVYTSQLSDINRNGVATVRLPDMNEMEIQGKIEFVNPEINPETRINLIRVTIPNKGHQLKPGMAAYVVLKTAARKSLSLPINAVIRDSKGASVWIETRKHHFKSVVVETGIENEDRIEIKSGLQNGNAVVVSGAYLLNSEYVFKKGANPMETHRY